MTRRKRRLYKKIRRYTTIALCVFCVVWIWRAVHAPDHTAQQFDASADLTSLTISDDGMLFSLDHTAPGTVEHVLSSKNIILGREDRVFPHRTQLLASHASVVIERNKKVTVHVDNSEKQITTYTKTVYGALRDGAYTLDTFDIVEPPRDTMLSSDTTITITRVRIEEEIVTKNIAFSTQSKKDDKLGWREKKISQTGTGGTREITYRISYHDDTEVGREKIKEEITKEPTPEIVTQGTYVKLGKAHKGQASWYAHKGCDCAANPWLPFGSYAKVTNRANGKSVIVRINDRGPFVPGRIIDLDKTAFVKIASLGAGVADIKMEEVKN